MLKLILTELTEGSISRPQVSDVLGGTDILYGNRKARSRRTQLLVLIAADGDARVAVNKVAWEHIARIGDLTG